jgi:hypothetical protein
MSAPDFSGDVIQIYMALLKKGSPTKRLGPLISDFKRADKFFNLAPTTQGQFVEAQGAVEGLPGHKLRNAASRGGAASGIAGSQGLRLWGFATGFATRKRAASGVKVCGCGVLLQGKGQHRESRESRFAVVKCCFKKRGSIGNHGEPWFRLWDVGARRRTQEAASGSSESAVCGRGMFLREKWAASRSLVGMDKALQGDAGRFMFSDQGTVQVANLGIETDLSKSME